MKELAMLPRWRFFPAAKDCPGMHEMRMSVGREEWGLSLAEQLGVSLDRCEDKVRIETKIDG
jgi:hypothetical protein